MRWVWLLLLVCMARSAPAAERLIECTYPDWATHRNDGNGSVITYPCSAAPCVYDDADKRVGSSLDVLFCPGQWCGFWFVDTVTSDWQAVPSPYCTMGGPWP